MLICLQWVSQTIEGISRDSSGELDSPTVMAQVTLIHAIITLMIKAMYTYCIVKAFITVGGHNCSSEGGTGPSRRTTPEIATADDVPVGRGFSVLKITRDPNIGTYTGIKLVVLKMYTTPTNP